MKTGVIAAQNAEGKLCNTRHTGARVTGEQGAGGGRSDFEGERIEEVWRQLGHVRLVVCLRCDGVIPGADRARRGTSGLQRRDVQYDLSVPARPGGR